MPLHLPQTIPFLLHILIELPASLSFLLHPETQTFSSDPRVHAVVRQYAVLLMTSNVIAAAFACREVDGTSRWVAAALGMYHLAPLRRAMGRIGHRETSVRGGLGGPLVHTAVHLGCLLALGGMVVMGGGEGRGV